jgi:linoleoyl-CoA desaturase
MKNAALKLEKHDLKHSPWTPEKFKAFGDEIYAIQNEVTAKMGKEDLEYIKRIRKISRISELLGRSLLHFSLDPLTWSAGIFALWVHKQLETTEIGHSALHGCWDGLKGAEIFYSASFQWDTPVDEESWKKGHNQLHHNYTNVVGRDPDLNFGPLRVSEKTPWSPFHLLQTGLFFSTAPFFTWAIGVHVTGLTDLNHPNSSEGYTKVLPDRSLKTILRAGYRTARKMVPYFLYNYTLWPLLAGPFWWKVLAGNFSADALRDIYTASTIYAGHFGEDLEYYDASFRPKGRGEWYKSRWGGP